MGEWVGSKYIRSFLCHVGGSLSCVSCVTSCFWKILNHLNIVQQFYWQFIFVYCVFFSSRWCFFQLHFVFYWWHLRFYISELKYKKNCYNCNVHFTFNWEDWFILFWGPFGVIWWTQIHVVQIISILIVLRGLRGNVSDWSMAFKHTVTRKHV